MSRSLGDRASEGALSVTKPDVLSKLMRLGAGLALLGVLAVAAVFTYFAVQLIHFAVVGPGTTPQGGDNAFRIVTGLFGVLLAVPPVGLGCAILWALFRAAGRAAFGEATLVVDDEVALGDRLSLRLTATPKRTVRPSTVEWELVGNEIAIFRGATRTSTYQNTFERLPTGSPPPGEWPAGTPIELSAEIAVPSALEPSFATSNHRIEWSAVVRIRIPRHVDVEVSQSIQVLMPGTAPPESWGRTRQTLEDGALTGELTLELPNDDGVATVLPGGRLVGSLRISSRDHVGAEVIWLRLIRLLHGSGTAEEAVHQEMILRQGGLASGESLSTDLDWTVPSTGEVSFQGRHVKCDWMLDVKVDRSMNRDLHLRFPIMVVAA